MTDIKVVMNDGTVREFKHEGRAGGNYTKTIRYETWYVVIEDEWRKQTVIPLTQIKEIEVTPHRY